MASFCSNSTINHELFLQKMYREVYSNKVNLFSLMLLVNILERGEVINEAKKYSNSLNLGSLV